MSETILIVTATCETTGCVSNGVPNVFERESDIEFVVHCGQCQNVIENLAVAPKE